MVEPTVSDCDFLIYMRHQINYLFPSETSSNFELNANRVVFRNVIEPIRAFQRGAYEQGHDISLYQAYRIFENLVLLLTIVIQYLYPTKKVQDTGSHRSN